MPIRIIVERTILDSRGSPQLPQTDGHYASCYEDEDLLEQRDPHQSSKSHIPMTKMTGQSHYFMQQSIDMNEQSVNGLLHSVLALVCPYFPSGTLSTPTKLDFWP